MGLMVLKVAKNDSKGNPGEMTQKKKNSHA